MRIFRDFFLRKEIEKQSDIEKIETIKLFKENYEDLRSKRKNELKIIFVNGESITQTIHNYQKKSVSYPWIKFYKWFFESDSPFYMLVFTNPNSRGETVIKREDIRIFTAKIID